MADTNRRTFLQHAGAAAAAAAVHFPLAARADETQADKAAEQRSDAASKVVMGWIGCGGRAGSLLQEFATQSDVAVTCICDPDESRLAEFANRTESITGRKPRAVADMRELLDDKSIDAVCIATPDHWHGPATILSVEAGKHVYVEKPCSHNVREGRLMVDAARRNKRIVQVGTQSRSSPPVIEAMEKLRSGAIGEVLVAKAWNSQRRRDIGHAKPTDPPAGLDYDLWVGPAPIVPYQPNLLHYGWHWFYDFGTGDMGNDGVHDLDIARWGLGVDTHPSTVAALGGKYYFDDDQQFPDTQYVVFDYPGDGQHGSRRQLIFEQRIWSPYRQEALENGDAFYGTEGMLILGKNDGWKLYGPKNELRETAERSGMGLPHYRDFLECVRSGQLPSADIEIGHLSAALCHLGNIATRLGRTLHFDPAAEKFVDDEEAQKLVGRVYRDGHWAAPKGA